GAATLGVADAVTERQRVAALDVIAELRQQRFELSRAAMHVADDVERAVLRLAIGPERGTLDGDRFDLFRAARDVHVTKAFVLQLAQGLAQLAYLAAHHVRPERALRARLVALAAQLFRQIQHDRRRQGVVLARQREQRLARFRLHIGRV